MNICQSVTAALVFVGQLYVVNPQKVQEGCLEIMDVNPVLCDVVTERIGFSVGNPRLDPATSCPNRKTPGVMIPTKFTCRQFPLAVIRTAKLPTPNDQGLFEQAALVKIGDQGSRSLVGLLAFTR